MGLPFLGHNVFEGQLFREQNFFGFFASDVILNGFENHFAPGNRASQWSAQEAFIKHSIMGPYCRVRCRRTHIVNHDGGATGSRLFIESVQQFCEESPDAVRNESTECASNQETFEHEKALFDLFGRSVRGFQPKQEWHSSCYVEDLHSLEESDDSFIAVFGSEKIFVDYTSALDIRCGGLDVSAL